MIYPLPGFKFVFACLLASLGLAALPENGWAGTVVGSALLFFAFVLTFGRLILALVLTLRR